MSDAPSRRFLRIEAIHAAARRLRAGGFDSQAIARLWRIPYRVANECGQWWPVPIPSTNEGNFP